MAAPLQRPARLFLTDDILSGRIAMDAYPLRYICIGAIGYGGGFAPEQIRVGPGSARSNEAVDQLLSTVELLESRGWELVSVYESGTQACLRRRTPR